MYNCFEVWTQTARDVRPSYVCMGGEKGGGGGTRTSVSGDRKRQEEMEIFWGCMRGALRSVYVDAPHIIPAMPLGSSSLRLGDHPRSASRSHFHPTTNTRHRAARESARGFIDVGRFFARARARICKATANVSLRALAFCAKGLSAEFRSSFL